MIAGFGTRLAGAYDTGNLAYVVASTVLVMSGPPVYALVNYCTSLPYPLHPRPCPSHPPSDKLHFNTPSLLHAIRQADRSSSHPLPPPLLHPLPLPAPPGPRLHNLRRTRRAVRNPDCKRRVAHGRQQSHSLTAASRVEHGDCVVEPASLAFRCLWPAGCGVSSARS
jgi:hypothetical protein